MQAPKNTMLFNSIEFLLFLPIVFLLYWGVFHRNLRWQNAFLVLSSYVFYGWWDWRFLILIAFTSLCSWWSGLLIYKNKSRSLVFLWLNIGTNLLILGTFKYFNFFVSNFVEAFALLGFSLHVTSLQLILPVGISFYTFQALSYSIDIYKEKIKPTEDYIAFFAYVSFFPQLVAGPIERATNLLPQILKSRSFKYEEAVDGCRQILWGFFKKVLIADNCAVYVDTVFNDYTQYNASTLWFGALMFTFQIYGDFSGYSDIAIGTAKLFGIRLKKNFNLPYFSRNVAEFWKRWHISLNTWFVDYVYIPLGGGRNGKWIKLRNTIIIFLTSGLWHGANWTYVFWGLYHALLFVPLILTGGNKKYNNIVAEEVSAGIRLSIRDIKFAPDSAQILSGESERLDEIAEVLKMAPNAQLLVEGHTASVGKPAGEQKLSEQRAHKIAEELGELASRNVPAPKLLISDRAQIVMSYHILFDSLEEARLAGKSFGSTKSGIAPFYSDKFAKIGIQVSELADMDALREKVEGILLKKNILLKHLYGHEELKTSDIMEELASYRDFLKPYTADTSAFLRSALAQGRSVLLEGQLGTMKDPDHGIYPMVTSSSTLAGYGAVGAGVPPYEIKKIVAVSKAYSSAVGAGEFVSEIFGDEAEELRRRGGDGGEYGATTGRPRRVGFYDAVASKYGCALQGATDVALTVLDVLGYLDEIPVCVAYEIDGKQTTDFPTTVDLCRAKPVWKTLPGWKCDISGIRNYEELPEACRNYVEFIEEQIGFPITMVSNGPGRDDIIYRNGSTVKR